MQSNFESVRRQDRIMEPTRALEILVNGEYGFLAVGTSKNGYGYGVPLNFTFDIEKNALFFHCAREGHKIDNLTEHALVSFCVVGKTQVVPNKFTTLYESVMAFGRAELVVNETEAANALQALIEKYSPEYKASGEKYIQQLIHRTQVVRIDIHHITAKSNLYATD